MERFGKIVFEQGVTGLNSPSYSIDWLDEQGKKVHCRPESPPWLWPSWLLAATATAAASPIPAPALSRAPHPPFLLLMQISARAAVYTPKELRGKIEKAQIEILDPPPHWLVLAYPPAGRHRTVDGDVDYEPFAKAVGMHCRWFSALISFRPSCNQAGSCTIDEKSMASDAIIRMISSGNCGADLKIVE